MKRFFEADRRIGLFSSVGVVALALSNPAFAQDADQADAEAEVVEEVAQPTGNIVVSGSRIQRPNLDATVPIASVDCG